MTHRSLYPPRLRRSLYHPPLPSPRHSHPICPQPTQARYGVGGAGCAQSFLSLSCPPLALYAQEDLFCCAPLSLYAQRSCAHLSLCAQSCCSSCAALSLTPTPPVLRDARSPLHVRRHTLPHAQPHTQAQTSHTVPHALAGVYSQPSLAAVLLLLQVPSPHALAPLEERAEEEKEEEAEEECCCLDPRRHASQQEELPLPHASQQEEHPAHQEGS